MKCGLIFYSNISAGAESRLTHTGPLSERHEGAEDAMNELGTMLDGEASL